MKVGLPRTWVGPGWRPPHRPELHLTLRVTGPPSGHPCSWPSLMASAALGPKARATSPSVAHPSLRPDSNCQGRSLSCPLRRSPPWLVSVGRTGWASGQSSCWTHTAHGQLPGEVGGGSPEVWLVLGVSGRGWWLSPGSSGPLRPAWLVVITAQLREGPADAGLPLGRALVAGAGHRLVSSQGRRTVAVLPLPHPSPPRPSQPVARRVSSAALGSCSERAFEGEILGPRR